MSRYLASIPSTRSPQDAFDYLAAFDNIRDWDPSVLRAKRLDSGPIVIGSAFEVVVKARSKEKPLRYEVIGLDPGRRIQLEAIDPAYRSFDTITVEPDAAGSIVTYDAVLEARGAMRLITPIVSRVFQKLAAAADRGLQRVLN